MRAFSFFDVAFLGAADEAVVTYAIEDFDGYTTDVAVTGLNLGTNWFWAHDGEARPICYDSMASYSASDEVDGLTGGLDWDTQAYQGFFIPQPVDTFQSYSNGNDLNGLTGGDDWGGNWVSR